MSVRAFLTLPTARVSRSFACRTGHTDRFGLWACAALWRFGRGPLAVGTDFAGTACPCLARRAVFARVGVACFVRHLAIWAHAACFATPFLHSERLTRRAHAGVAITALSADVVCPIVLLPTGVWAARVRSLCPASLPVVRRVARARVTQRGRGLGCARAVVQAGVIPLGALVDVGRAMLTTEARVARAGVLVGPVHTSAVGIERHWLNRLAVRILADAVLAGIVRAVVGVRFASAAAKATVAAITAVLVRVDSHVVNTRPSVMAERYGRVVVGVAH